MPVIDALRRKYGFTKTEEDIADYILAHSDEVASMKIGDVNPDTPFLEGQGTRDIMSSVANLSKQAIDQTYNSLSPAELRKAAKLIMGAHRIIIYGIGDSEISCEMFANLMLKIGVTCFMANQHGDALAVSTALGPGDVALLVSYSGGLVKQFDNELKLIFERGIKAIAVTSDESLRDQLAGVECVLTCSTGETNQGKIATYYAQSCIRFILNCLYGECFAQNYRKNAQMQEFYAQHRGH